MILKSIFIFFENEVACYRFIYLEGELSYKVRQLGLSPSGRKKRKEKKKVSYGEQKEFHEFLNDLISDTKYPPDSFFASKILLFLSSHKIHQMVATVTSSLLPREPLFELHSSHSLSGDGSRT